jgi:hypothetical protein
LQVGRNAFMQLLAQALAKPEEATVVE